MKRLNIWVISPFAPQDHNVGWIDTSTEDGWVARMYNGAHVEEVENPTPDQMGWDPVAGISEEEIEQLLATKQDKLISGENIKTINGETLLGEGDISLPTESDLVFEKGTGTNSVQQKGTGVKAIGQSSIAAGTGESSKSSYTVSGAANTTTYTTSAAHGLSVGDVVNFHSVYARIIAVNNTTSFTVNTTLDSTIGLGGAKINIIKGVAFGSGSTTFGNRNIATGDEAFATGKESRAIGDQSTAEGYGVSAIGTASHAEGHKTIASGQASHAEGDHTLAQNSSEHAAGKYNLSHKKTTGTDAEKNAGTTQYSIGIGPGSGATPRLNAVEVMQNGDAYFKGIGDYNGTNPNTSGVKPLADVFNEKQDIPILLWATETPYSIESEKWYKTVEGEIPDICAPDTAKDTVISCYVFNPTSSISELTCYKVSGDLGSDTTTVYIQPGAYIKLTATINSSYQATWTVTNSVISSAVSNIVSMSQTDYDNLQNKDASTLYIIV